MIERLLGQVSFHGQPARTLRARIIVLILSAVGMSACLLALSAAAAIHSPWLLLLAILEALACAALFIVLRRGRVNLAAHGVIALTFSLLLTSLPLFGQLRALLFLIPILAAILVELPATLVYIALCSFAAGFVAWEPLTNRLIFISNPLNYEGWLMHTLAYILSGMLMYIVGQVLHQSFASAQAEIDQRRQLEARLSLFEYSFDHTANPALWVDQAGRFLFANQAVCNLLQFKHATLLQSAIQHIDPYLGAQWPETWAYLQQYHQLEIKTQLTGVNGEAIPVELNCTLMNIDGQEYACIFVRDVRQQLADEKILQENEERLRMIFERSPIGIAIVDTASGRFLQVNPKYCEITARSEADLLKLAFSDITHPDDVEIDQANTRKIRSGEIKSLKREKRYIRPDGSLVWVELTIVPIRDIDGAINMHLTMASDISQRKHLEKALTEEHAFFDQVISTMGQGLAVYNQEFRLIFCNPAYAKMMGYESEEIIGSDLLFLTPPAYRQIVEDITKQRIQGNRSTYETGLLHKNGQTIPVLVNGVPRFENGRFIGTIAAITDLTHIKEIETSLTSERNFLRTVIDNIPDRIFAKDTHGRIVISNLADAVSRGLKDPAEMVGRMDDDFHDPVESAFYRRQDQYVVQYQLKFQVERLQPDQQGDARWFKISKVPWLDPSGEVAGVVGIASDITEHKLIEEQLSEANTQLNDQIEKLNELQEQLREQAIRDPLTCLYNRRYLNETLPREIARALRAGTPLGFLMIDLDHFKQVNDTHGHAVGDQVLVAVANVISSQVRSGDIACRYGGEEFLVVMNGSNCADALRRAEELRAAIAACQVSDDVPSLRQTASIGVAVLPTHGLEVITVLMAADNALYKAKEAGRNCVRPASEEPDCQA